MLKRIDHIGVVVDDLAEARRFLSDGLGLEITRELELPAKAVKAAFFRCGDVEIECFELTSEDARAARLRGEQARIDHIAIEVDDLEGTLRALSGLGVRADAPAPTVVGRNLNYWTVPETCDGVQYQFVQKNAV